MDGGSAVDAEESRYEKLASVGGAGAGNGAVGDDAVGELRRALELLARRERELEDTQDVLRDERRERDAFLDWLPDAYLETDDMGVVLDANPASEVLLGRRLRFLIGKPLPPWWPPRAAAASERRCRRVREDGMPRRDRPRAADHQRTARLRDGGRQPGQPSVAGPRLRWLLRDVTEDRQARLELRILNEELEGRVAARTAEREQARANLTAVLEHMPLGVAMTDAEGRIVAANPAAEAILGRRLAFGWEHPFMDVPAYAPDGRRYEPDDRPISRSLRHGEIVVGERLEFDGGGEGRVAVEVNTAPVRDGDTLLGGVVVFRDVTDAERRDRAMQEFVVNAAHEMRTPVASIAASLDVLEGGAKDVPAERERFLDHLRDATDRLTSLIHALLLLARVDSGHEDVPLDVVPLAPLLAELRAGARPGRGVRVDVDCQEDLVAVTSATLLRQALSAVVDNAIRYTETGSILLSAEPLAGDRVAVVVTDTGPGMDRATLEAATTRFFRGRDGRGFGIGLSIAKRAVEAAGGELVLESEPGSGTTVRINVPAGRIVAT